MLIGDNNLYPKRGAHQIIALHVAMFVWLISHQPAVFFSQNKPTSSNQAAVIFSQNKSAPATSQTNGMRYDALREIQTDITINLSIPL
jgi:flagellar basal body-associated protein FliL